MHVFTHNFSCQNRPALHVQQNLVREEGLITSDFSFFSNDPTGFLNAVGDFPNNIAGSNVEALIILWNNAVSIDIVTPERLLPVGVLETFLV